MKTFSIRARDIKRERVVIDASGRTLGRLATQVARLLMGKHKPVFTPNTDTGDFVVITNAAKVVVTGRKAKQKLYYRHTGYPGGFKVTAYEDLVKRSPTRAVEHAIEGMLPHTRLGAAMKKKLTVYAGEAPGAPKASAAESPAGQNKG
ncbi:MAG: 50S ribosomal protein L13 [Chloroflexi bacterium]|nr:50S ribosomal protein L13 [Chloroflexota bacterium]